MVAFEVWSSEAKTVRVAGPLLIKKRSIWVRVRFIRMDVDMQTTARGEKAESCRRVYINRIRLRSSAQQIQTANDCVGTALAEY
ncbi:hypothetical protein J2T11_000037 [Paenarthrobacter nicotinovorans]|nr:hypothetical protein [Paenarthrobacter nicotinovorans]